MLRQMVTSTQARLETIDSQGTKGVGVVQAQLTEVVKDLTELKVDVAKRFDDHARVHDQDSRDRSAQRRWTVTTFLAALAIIVTLLLNITIRLH